MHWFDCSLLVTTLCAACGINSAVCAEDKDKNADTVTTVDPNENTINFEATDSIAFEYGQTEKPVADSVANSTVVFANESQNLTHPSNSTDFTSNDQVGPKETQKRDVANGTFNDITPLLLFPILPFLFPPREDQSPEAGKNVVNLKNGSEIGDNPGGVKPFIFFDFAFNIRRIPLKNRTERSNMPKELDEKKVNISKTDDSEQNSPSNRRRRNTNAKTNTISFFDDLPLFPDSELDEFLPKPDLFFPDLPFHHKFIKKLSRRKRDQKKPDLKSDLKLFMDVFDEAFMRTKREVERTDPFLKILREAEQSFDDDRKEPDDPFSPVSDLQDKPSMKWRIQRNLKRLKNDRRGDLEKAQESPMIIVDKVVKIGEFHMHDEGHDKNKLKKKKKKRDAKDSKSVFLSDDIQDDINPIDDSEIDPKDILGLLKQESKNKKRSHYANVQSKEIRVLPHRNMSVLSVGGNATIEMKQKEAEMESQTVNTSGKVNKYGNLLKVVDSLKSKIKMELQNVATVGPTTGEKAKVKGSGLEKKKKRSYDDLKKNVTELIEQFLAVVKKIDDTQLMGRLDLSEQEDLGEFDWTEKETLQDAYLLGKDSRGRRVKKHKEMRKPFVPYEREVPRKEEDLAFLLLTISVPTAVVLTVLLLICLLTMHLKGALCTKLFRPRKTFLVDEEVPAQLIHKITKTSGGVKKI